MGITDMAENKFKNKNTRFCNLRSCNLNDLENKLKLQQLPRGYLG